MLISIMQWRVEIGMFYRKSKVRYRDRILLLTIHSHIVAAQDFFLFL